MTYLAQVKQNIISTPTNQRILIVGYTMNVSITRHILAIKSRGNAGVSFRAVVMTGIALDVDNKEREKNMDVLWRAVAKSRKPINSISSPSHVEDWK